VFPIEEAVARLLAPLPQAPPLTLEDLHGVQGELPQAAEPVRAAGYASARDAIERLMGASAPAPPLQPTRMGSRGAMDVEATLDALSSTLGGAPASVPAPAPKSDMASTVKLTSEEIRTAMAAAVEARAQAPMPAATQRPSFPQPAEAAPAPQPEAAVQGSDLLKIQLEQETCQNVSVDQMTAWIEQGRVLEYHMVSRQHSDHWIEASKVPALRPVFDRVRKLREIQVEEEPKAIPEPPPVKRGLFSGLFGRN